LIGKGFQSKITGALFIGICIGEVCIQDTCPIGLFSGCLSQQSDAAGLFDFIEAKICAQDRCFDAIAVIDEFGVHVALGLKALIRKRPHEFIRLAFAYGFASAISFKDNGPFGIECL